MKQIVLTSLIALMLSILVGCGGEVIDASSKQAMESSISQITADMSAAEQAQFSKDVQMVMRDGERLSTIIFRDHKGDRAAAEAAMRERIDGMSVEDIRAKASELRARS